MPYAPISISSSGDTTLVQAQTGRKIRVQSYFFRTAGAVSVTWKSGSNAISGAIPFTTSDLAQCSASGPNANGPDGVLETNGGEALVMNLSGAVLVAGHLRYEVVQ